MAQELNMMTKMHPRDLARMLFPVGGIFGGIRVT